MSEFNEKGYFMTASGLKSTDPAARDETSKLSKRLGPKGSQKTRKVKFDRDSAAMRIYMNEKLEGKKDDKSRLK